MNFRPYSRGFRSYYGEVKTEVRVFLEILRGFQTGTDKNIGILGIFRFYSRVLSPHSSGFESYSSRMANKRTSVLLFQAEICKNIVVLRNFRSYSRVFSPYSSGFRSCFNKMRTNVQCYFGPHRGLKMKLEKIMSFWGNSGLFPEALLLSNKSFETSGDVKCCSEI